MGARRLTLARAAERIDAQRVGFHAQDRLAEARLVAREQLERAIRGAPLNVAADLRQERELFTELPRQLGVRPAGREVADVYVRGRIVGYDDVARNYTPGGANQPSQVVEHEVQVSIAIQLIDTKRNVILWESSRLTGRGTYNLASQTFEDGRAVAIQDLTRQIVDGAQSQW